MANERTIRVLVVPVGKDPEVREFPSGRFGVEARKLVGGDFEVHELDVEEAGGGIDAFVNAMGVADGLPRNRWVPRQYLHGTIVVARADNMGKTVSLTDVDVEVYSVLLNLETQARLQAAPTARKGPTARVLVIPVGKPPQMAWVPAEDEDGAICGVQALVDGEVTTQGLEGPAGGKLRAFANLLAEESGDPKNQCVDGQWLHGTIVVGRPQGDDGFTDLTDADLQWCTKQFGLDLSHLELELAPRVVVEFPVDGPA